MGACTELEGHAFDSSLSRFDVVFISDLAESARSRRGVGAESAHRSIFFVGQNGGVATPPRSRDSAVEFSTGQCSVSIWYGLINHAADKKLD